MPRCTRSVHARPLRFPYPENDSHQIGARGFPSARPSQHHMRGRRLRPLASLRRRRHKETPPPRNSHLALARRESLPPKDEATVHSLLSTARPGVSHCGNPAVNTRDIDQEVVMELLCSGIPGAPLNRESPEVSTFRQPLSLALILPLALLLSPLVLVGVIVLVASDADRSFQNEP